MPPRRLTKKQKRLQELRNRKNNKPNSNPGLKNSELNKLGQIEVKLNPTKTNGKFGYGFSTYFGKNMEKALETAGINVIKEDTREVIKNSMTEEEIKNPDKALETSRLRRISIGSGVSENEAKRHLQQMKGQKTGKIFWAEKDVAVQLQKLGINPLVIMNRISDNIIKSEAVRRYGKKRANEIMRGRNPNLLKKLIEDENIQKNVKNKGELEIQKEIIRNLVKKGKSQ